MPEGQIAYALNSDGVLCCEIANRSKKNALDDVMLAQLDEALRLPHVRAVVIRGRGGHFCSGFDLDALKAWAREPVDRLPDAYLGEVLERLEAHEAPSFAVVDGVCFGAGCELACACDFRVAADTARFCMPPAKLGIVYSARGIERMVQKSSLQAVRRLLMTAQEMSAPEAHRAGLVDAISATVERTANDLVQHVLGLDDRAVTAAKRGLWASARGESPHIDETVRRQAFLRVTSHLLKK
jgi:enoyl-CoA hydratase/carnithine racemase